MTTRLERYRELVALNPMRAATYRLNHARELDAALRAEREATPSPAPAAPDPLNAIKNPILRSHKLLMRDDPRYAQLAKVQSNPSEPSKEKNAS